MVVCPSISVARKEVYCLRELKLCTSNKKNSNFLSELLTNIAIDFEETQCIRLEVFCVIGNCVIRIRIYIFHSKTNNFELITYICFLKRTYVTQKHKSKITYV